MSVKTTPPPRVGRSKLQRRQAATGIGFLTPFLVVFALVLLAPVIY